MLRFTITGVDGVVDGVHDLDLDKAFNGRELNLVKKVSGVRLGEMNEALAAGDYSLMLAFATIALVRLGRVNKELAMKAYDLLDEAEAGCLSVEDVKEEGDGDAAPLHQPTPSEQLVVATET